MSRNKMVIKHTAVMSGSGRLTSEDLKEAGNSLPPGAVVTVKHHSDQRDGDSWVIQAEWDAVAQANFNQATVKRDTGDYFGR